MLFACIVVPCFVVQASLRCEPEPKRLAWSTRPAPSPFSMALIRCREFSSVATSMHGEQGTFSAFLSSRGCGEEGRHGEVLRSFRVAGRFAARSNWQADLGDFEREVDRSNPSESCLYHSGTITSAHRQISIMSACSALVRVGSKDS